MCDFTAPGSYGVKLGKSFTDASSSSAPVYYSMKFNSRLDPSMASRKATLYRNSQDSYIAEWSAPKDNEDAAELVYEATSTNPQEVDCLLIYDEETQTFTLERPTLKFNMRKSRTQRRPLKNHLADQLSLPKPSAVVSNGQSSSQATNGDTDNLSAEDDFGRDVAKDMAEILDEDDEDDDDDEEERDTTSRHPHEEASSSSSSSDDSDTFEEVTPQPVSIAQKRPLSHDAGPSSTGRTSPDANNKRRRKLNAETKPMRHLNGHQYGGKSIARTQAIQAEAASKRASSGQSSDSDDSSSSGSSGSSDSSDSGSESSGSSDSGSDGSSESGSSSTNDDDDDDVMLDLEQDIKRSLSGDKKSAPSTPARPQYAGKSLARTSTLAAQRSGYHVQSPMGIPSPSTSSHMRKSPSRAGKPVSLRALFDDNGQGDEEEGITSSDSDSS